MQYLKTKSLVGPYEHVLQADPAFDQGKGAKARKAFTEAYERAIETGDFKDVPRQSGLEPVVWTLRHLSGPEWRFVQDINSRFGLNSACYEAVALALLSVTGLELDIERGADRSRRGWDAVGAEQMEALDSAVVNELGLRVIGEQGGPRKG